MHRSIATLGTALVVSFVVASGLGGCPKGASERTAAAASASVVSDPIVGRRIDVEANGKGFTPSSIEVKKGEATTLVFTRTTSETCATAVVFPELKITRTLPLKTPIAINLPVGDARTLGFECGMGMYKSKIVVQ